MSMHRYLDVLMYAWLRWGDIGRLKNWSEAIAQTRMALPNLPGRLTIAAAATSKSPLIDVIDLPAALDRARAWRDGGTELSAANDEWLRKFVVKAESDAELARLHSPRSESSEDEERAPVVEPADRADE